MMHSSDEKHNGIDNDNRNIKIGVKRLGAIVIQW